MRTTGTNIVSGDTIGQIKWRGYAPTSGYVTAASITSTSSGTIANNRVAGNLVFATHPDSATGTTPTTRMTIGADGGVTIDALASLSDYGVVLHNASGLLSTSDHGTAGHVLTSNGAGAAPTFQVNPADGIVTLAGDSGTATGATVTIAGGTNCATSAGTATLTVNVDAALTGITSVTVATGGELRTGTTATNTLLVEAYDVDGTAYVPFITLTAADTPTCDLASGVTIGSSYIYRASGTDVAVADGGTGLSTLTAHALYVGNGASSPTALSVGGAGTILTGVNAADPTWTTATYPATAAIGDVLVASAANVIGVQSGAVTAGYVLTANGAGSAPTFQANAGGGVGTIAGDSGTATGATVTIAGGTNCTTSAGTATLTVNVDAALTGITSITGANGAEIRTGTTAADTLLISAYDVDGTAYVPFITLTANNTPTMDLASATTIGSAYIYRASGTDVAVADGGTGLSTLTAHAVYVGNGASAPTALSVGAVGEVLVGVATADPKWLAAGTDGKVLTAHTGADPSWETPGGSTWLTKADIDANATATVNYAYTINHATPANLLEVTLPATAAVGSRVEIVGNTAGMWKLIAAGGDTIKLGSATTSAGGYLAATNQYDCIEVVCTVADTTWVTKSVVGNLTYA